MFYFGSCPEQPKLLHLFRNTYLILTISRQIVQTQLKQTLYDSMGLQNKHFMRSILGGIFYQTILQQFMLICLTIYCLSFILISL